jgi:uncharacterized protein (UPF0303 family)
MTVNFEADLQKVIEQEALLCFGSFDLITAQTLGLRIIDAAKPLGPVIVDIRSGDNLMFFAGLPGTNPANADWARRKRNLANLLQRSTMFYDLENKLGRNIVELMKLNPRDYAVNGGCVPIRVNGAGIVATVTVSGLSSREDHKLATDAIAALTGQQLGASGF